jgi:hypothetical protein
MPGIDPQERNKTVALSGLLILFALLTLPLLCFLFFDAFKEAQHQHQVNQTYLSVDARIVSSSVRISHGSKGRIYYTPEINYAYEVNGSYYQSSKLRAIYVSGDADWAYEIVSHYRPEQTYKAWYNPLKPDEAILINTYSFSPYFDMLEAAFCISVIVPIWLALWFNRQLDPVSAGNGLFKFLPQFSAEQQLTVAQVGTAIWYGLGALTAAHYYYFVPAPHTSYAWHVLMAFAALGLIPAGFILRCYSITRNLTAPQLLLNHPAVTPGREFNFTISQKARREITLTSVNMWLQCISVTSKGRHNSQRSQLHKEHPIALRNHPLHAGEPLELSGALTIPPGLPDSGRDPTHERTSIHWNITLECRIKGGQVYQTKFPITVTSTPVEEVSRPSEAGLTG